MYITKLILSKYKRLMLADIQHFEYTPTQAMQLIIGSNGSGKSSVCEELSPLPAHHSGFAKGGCKTIHLTHANRHYQLHSVYNGGSGQHSFICEETELNKGGTFAVQKELVEQHFGLTREIHELLVGITTFSSMTTQKRREWLTRMTPVSLDYAFNLYNRVKTTHRDQQGVVKHLAKRLVQEQQDLPDGNEQQLHRQSVDRLTQQLNKLFELRHNDEASVFVNSDALISTLKPIVDKAKQLLNKSPAVTVGFDVTNQTQLEQRIQHLEVGLAEDRAKLEQLIDEHAQWTQRMPAKDAQLSEEQIQELRQSLNSLSQQQVNWRPPAVTSVFPLVEIPSDERHPQQLLDNTLREWIALINLFPDNSDSRFTRSKGEQAEEQLRELTKEQLSLEATCQQLRSKISHWKGCETVHCPQCDHGFIPHVGVNDIENAEKSLEDTSIRLSEVVKSIEKVKEYLEHYNDYLGLVRAFKRLATNSHSAFKPVWDYCLEHRVMFSNPKSYLTDLQYWQRLMEDRLTQQELQRSIDLIAHKLQYVEAIDRETITLGEQRRKSLDEQISTLTHATRFQQLRIKEFRDIQVTFARYVQDIDAVCNDLETVISNAFKQLRFEYQHAVKTETQQAQIALAQHQEALSRVNMRAGLLADIQSQYDEAIQSQQDHSLLVKVLAPTDGLIGRYLMGFMQNIVVLINAVIAEVWTYPMEVLPSQVESDELDYKFPLSVNNGAVTAPDISLGSTSQVDIVDFAFKLLAMKLLRLEEHPLYLDELGSSFDEQHRLNLIPFINRLLETGQVRQLFYISHYVATHGAFNQAEVCVLDPTNITVPQTYNQHVVIH